MEALLWYIIILPAAVKIAVVISDLLHEEDEPQ